MNGLSALMRRISLVGMGNAVRALRYTAMRDRLNARRPQPAANPAVRPLGALASARQTPSGARFTFASAELTVRFLAPDMVFVAWDGAAGMPSWAAERVDWPEVEVKLEGPGAAWTLGSAALLVRVEPDGAVSLLRADGRLLRRDGPPERRAVGWSQGVAFPPDASLYGLGERFAGLDLMRGNGTRTFRLWNTDPGGTYGPGADPLYICMPVYLSACEAGCHVAFHDNSFDGSLTVGAETRLEFSRGPCRAYFAVGTPERAFELFTSLTGRPPLPPLWALGYHQSRWGYRTQEEIARIFAGFRERGLPLSAIHLDIDHLRGHRTLTIDASTHPDLPGLSRELREAGVHLVVSTDPGIKREKGFPLYEDGAREGVFCRLPDGREFKGVVWAGWSVFPDFTSPAARAWWGRQYTRQLDNGIDGFWHDMNEPASFVSSGDPTFPLCVRHNGEGWPTDHREAHNIYGTLMNRSGYEGLRALRPDRRPFIFSRSGWTGMQRWAWAWTGDVETSWGAMRSTVACVLGLGMSGMPYAGPDVGGFSGAPSPELFVRWFQLSSFLPFFRTHCAFYLPAREPWSFGPETLAVVKASLEQRYRLLPYWYTCAWRASAAGTPLVRPLFWGEPGNRALRGVDDAFLLGPDILVAPVLDDGARRRRVLLPAGGWYEIEGGAFHDGGREIEIDAPLERVPVFARAGSIIPVRENGGLTLLAFASPADGTASGLLYSDAGDGFGDFRLDELGLEPSAGAALALGRSGSGTRPWEHSSIRLRLHGFAASRATLGAGLPPGTELLT